MRDVEAGAHYLVERLGAPRAGVVLGSGFAKLAVAWGAERTVPFEYVPGYPPRRAPGHGGGVAAIDVPGGRAWLFLGRLHLYEGHDALTAAHPIELLAEAGASRVLLTCAAGGLLPGDRPGDLALVTDHLNLQGDDPTRRIPPERRDPAFLDLQNIYDPAWAEAWRDEARRARVALRDGILAALPGPSYETPAEVRMLRALGANLASMSVVPEAIAARYRGLRVAAIACISNRGAGMDGESIAHDGVVRAVETAAITHATFVREGLSRLSTSG